MLGGYPLGATPLGASSLSIGSTAHVSLAGAIVVSNILSPEAYVTLAGAISVVRFPSLEIEASEIGAIVATNYLAPAIQISDVGAIVVTAGRPFNPTVRAWTFTLDGHDFYVLRLGDNDTLVYDTYSKQWMDWDSGDLDFWRPNTGFTWQGGQDFAFGYGSAVVCGDDAFGLLWILDPELAYDQHPDETSATQEIAFDRIVMGQVPMRGREVLPCYTIFLAGDNYGLSVTDFTPGVTLEYSDDAGKTFDSAGTITVTPSTVDQEYNWYSLGQIEAPGRLFRITDNGVFARIDYMEMNDPDGT